MMSEEGGVPPQAEAAEQAEVETSEENAFSGEKSKDQELSQAAQGSEQEIELEINGVPKKFKKEQILNVVRNYEELQGKYKNYEATQAQVENLFSNLKENPHLIWDLAESLGHDPRELTKKKFQEYLEYEKMTPEQKRIYELEKQIKTFEQQKEEQEKSEKEKQFEMRVEQNLQQIQKEFEDFYKAHPNLKPSAYLAQEIVDVQRRFLDKKGKRPSVEEAYKIFKERQNQNRKYLFTSEDDLPEEVLRLARKRLAKQTRNFTPPPLKKSARQEEERGVTKKKKKKELTIEDFFGSDF